jgi:Macrocin-O-methyltransferase (TylF)
MNLRRSVRRHIRLKLIATGHRLASTKNSRLRRLDGFFELGRWSAAAGGRLPDLYDTREELFEAAAQRVRGNQPLYLEFGVYRGDSLRWWARRLALPRARFVGFDSFEGLPEDWNEFMPAGAFAVDEVPEFHDTRISLEIGWFDQTLPVCEFPAHDQLIVNVDCDIYSSTALVLHALAEQLKPGTLIYFDELHDPDHELRALKEFLATETQIRLLPIGVSGEGANWFFEVVH